MKEIIDINTCRIFMEYTKLRLKHEIVFLRRNVYISTYVNICNLSKTPVRSRLPRFTMKNGDPQIIL